MENNSGTIKTPEAASAKASIIGIAAIFLLTLLVYIRCLGNGFVNFDDLNYIVNNKLIHSINLSNLRHIWLSPKSGLPYYPAVFTFYMIEYALWGARPAGYHAVSVLLHAVNSCLVYLLVIRLFRNRTAALIAGLLMGLHPLHVDSVAWISDRKDLLSAFFVFISLNAYISYIHEKGRGWYWLAVLAYALALFSKPMAALMPFMLLIVDYQQRRKDRRLEIVEKVPFFAIAIGLGVIALLVQMTRSAQAPEEIFSFYSRENAAAAAGFYLIKLLAPIKLTVLYPSAHPAWGIWLAVAAGIAYLTTTIWMLMLSRDYGFGLAWFALLIFPILGFIPFGYVINVAPFANHFMYVADVGLFVCAGLLTRDILKGLEGPGRSVFFLLLIVSFSLFAIKTFLRTGIWKDSVSLWIDAIKYNDSPNSTIAHHNLSLALKSQGNLKEALVQARKAYAAYPRNKRAAELVKQLEASLKESPE